MSDQILNGPAAVIARAAAMAEAETRRDEFRQAAKSADAVTWPDAGVDPNTTIARMAAQADIADRRLEAQRQREWAEAGGWFAEASPAEKAADEEQKGWAALAHARSNHPLMTVRFHNYAG